MIEVTELTKSFGDFKAVDSVSFEIPRGQIVGLLGPNGAGKTTTMRMLTTFLPPDAGKARVAGFDVSEDPLEVRRRIGYLPESAPLYQEMGIEQYLRYTASIRGISGADRRRQIGEMLEVCGLNDVLDRDIGQLSKGYRQRVGLAATLLHDPDCLVLDEPTSGLDPNQIKEIRQVIRRIAENKTVVLSTHILPEVEATCDRVVIIAEGQIKADDTTAGITAGKAGAIHYSVGVKGDAASAEQVLKSSAFVQSLERLADQDGHARFRLTASSEGGGAERVYQLAVEKGLVLVELSEQRSSLEDVFAQLTLKGGD